MAACSDSSDKGVNAKFCMILVLIQVNRYRGEASCCAEHISSSHSHGAAVAGGHRWSTEGKTCQGPTCVLLKLLAEAGVVVSKPGLSKHGPTVPLSREVSRERQAGLVERSR